MPRRAAFTLLELLLVLALLGLMMALALPDFVAASEGERLRESAQRVQALVAMCRAEAMNEARRYRIEVRPDGTLCCRRQLDAVLAPHLMVRVREPWVTTAPLLAGVWVAGVQALPDGPPPIWVVDERLEFPEMEIEPVPITDFEQPVAIDFEPDGACTSIRLLLRDERGRGLLLTLDGRLGSMDVQDFAAVDPSDLERPEPLPEEKEPEYDLEDFRR